MEMYLVYMTYKLVIHIHYVVGYRIDSVIVDYYVDKFGGFWLKNVRNLCWKDVKVDRDEVKGSQRVTEIAKEKYIVLEDKIQEYFAGWRVRVSDFHESEKRR